MGALGYIPHALKDSLAYFRIKNKAALIRKITLRIAQGAHAIWIKRCQELIKNAAQAPPPYSRPTSPHPPPDITATNTSTSNLPQYPGLRMHYPPYPSPLFTAT
ncbi:uncharacterized protein ACA1_227120 [Acanthamoeba castellanii str. Neff]|uniref:Uncharacterized protein n=1 Tax=Acanthamoeba castellanii (strain ATCC 30010 / Neff) TaxID=1257118 RepID=L8H8L6_ACACF|nr:uncharacterized protein ACA1_227120 [Acanthamoeba castellanii str. Neff]ELR21562.1 hypothetical protein ACA1_227120 [Acanthamoeba castellanii str. Neff]